MSVFGTRKAPSVPACLCLSTRRAQTAFGVAAARARGAAAGGRRPAPPCETSAPLPKRHLLGCPRTERALLSRATEARTFSYQVHPYGGGHRRLDLRAHVLDEGVLVLPMDDHLGPGGGHQEGVVLLLVDVQDDLQAWAERAARGGQRLGQRPPGSPALPAASGASKPRPRHFRQARGRRGLDRKLRKGGEAVAPDWLVAVSPALSTEPELGTSVTTTVVHSIRAVPPCPRCGFLLSVQRDRMSSVVAAQALGDSPGAAGTHRWRVPHWPSVPPHSCPCPHVSSAPSSQRDLPKSDVCSTSHSPQGAEPGPGTPANESPDR